MLLKDYVPFFIAEIQEFKSIYEEQQAEIDKLSSDVEDLKQQCFVITATWGIILWEYFVGIPIDNSKTIEERRSRVLGKLRGQGTSTVEVIKRVAQSFVQDGLVDVIEHNLEYYFEIALKSNTGFPYGLTGLYDSIDEIKPAHLREMYKLVAVTQSKIYIGLASDYGETITNYPLDPNDVESKVDVYLPFSQEIGSEIITNYPKEG